MLYLVQEFYRVLEAASTRQQLTRACVRHALQQLPHGFDALDTCLLYHASLVNDAYDKWYRAFAQAVRVSILGSVLPVDTQINRQGGALVITGVGATLCISAADAACTFRAASYAPGMLGRRFNTMRGMHCRLQVHFLTAYTSAT